MPIAKLYDLNQEITDELSGPLYDLNGKFLGEYVYTNDEAKLNTFFQAWIETYQEDQRFFLSVDLETGGLDPVTCPLILVSISWDGRNALVFDYRRIKPSLFAELLNTVNLSNTNIKFDIEFLIHNEHVNPTVVFDTQLGCQVGWAGCWPGGKRFSLEMQCEHLLRGLKLDKDVRKGFIGMPDSQDPTRKQIEYAAIDSITTHNLVTPISNRLEFTKMAEMFYKVEMPLVPVLAKSELRGVPIDFEFLEERCEEGLKALKAQKSEINNDIKQIQGGTELLNSLPNGEFNPGASPQVPKVLRFLGLPAKNAQADHLEEIKANHYHPILEKVMEYRAAADLLSRFANKYPKHLNPATGRVHPNFKQIEAVTGRLSCQDPPMQGVTEVYRPMVVAPPGYRVGQVDLSQFELRAIAGFSGERTFLDSFKERAELLPSMKALCHKLEHDDPDHLTKVFAKGGLQIMEEEAALIKRFAATDIHRKTAALVTGKLTEEITSTERSIYKTLNYALLYGAEAATVKISLAKEGVVKTIEECEKIILTYFETLQTLKGWIDRVRKETDRDRMVRAHSGRARWFDLPPTWRSDFKKLHSAMLRETINYHCQESNATATKLAMPVVQRYIEDELDGDAWIPINVHDELVLIAREEKIYDLVEKTGEAMIWAGGEAIGYSCPIEVSMAIGERWQK